MTQPPSHDMLFGQLHTIIGANVLWVTVAVSARNQQSPGPHLNYRIAGQQKHEEDCSCLSEKYVPGAFLAQILTVHLRTSNFCSIRILTKINDGSDRKLYEHQRHSEGHYVRLMCISLTRRCL